MVEAARVPERGTRKRIGDLLRQARALAPFACLSVASGATFDLIGTGAPLVLRAHGLPLADLSWLQMIYLPVGIAFLWAPFIDRWRLPFLSHRLGWIVGAQAITILLLLVTGQGTHWPLPLLLTLAIAISVMLATADVALQALIVETIPREARPPTIVARLVGSSLGSMVGVALPTAFSESLALPATFGIMALADLLLTLPILFYRERARRLDETGEAQQPVAGHLRRMLPRAAIIGLYCIPAILIGSTPSLALLDLGLPLSTVGLLGGPTSTAITIAAMAASGYGLLRVSARTQVFVLAAGVTCAGLLLALGFLTHSAAFGMSGALLEIAFDAGLTVPVNNLMYRWSEGKRAATDYALLSGVSFMICFPARLLAPGLASLLGWPLFFGLCAPLYFGGAALLAAAMSGEASRAKAPRQAA